MKTTLIDELAKTPVNRDGLRSVSPRRLVHQLDESETVERHGHDEERYRVELKLGATFVARAGPAHRQRRQMQHELMMRSLTEHIYGDVRHTLMTEMFPIIADCEDWDAREAMQTVMEKLLEMTKP